MGWSRVLKSSSQRAISRHWPIAARACSTCQRSRWLREDNEQRADGESVLYLNGSQSFWSFVYVHASQANSNGSGGHNDNPMSIAPEMTRRFDDERESRQERLVCVLIANRARP